MRTYFVFILSTLLIGCSADKDVDTGTQVTTTTTATATTTTTSTTATNTTTTSSTTATSTASGLLGDWRLDTQMGPYVVEFTWSILTEPECSITSFEPVSQQGSVTDCDYTATATELMFRDTDCPQFGTYAYTIVGDQLQLTLIDEPCPGRADVIALPWTRVAP